MPDALTAAIPTGPSAEVWIVWVWHATLCVAALGLAGLLLFALDIVLFPRWWPSPWMRPLCWLFGHIEDQDFDITDEGFFDVCTRCGHRTPGEED